MTVELHHQSPCRPAEVDLEVSLRELDRVVHEWRLDSALAAEFPEAAFKLAASGTRGGTVKSEQAATRRGALVPPGSIEHVRERVQLEDPPNLGLVERPLEHSTVCNRGKVEQGPGDRGAGDRRDLGEVPLLQSSASMGPNLTAEPAGPPRGGDVDPTGLDVEQAMQHRR